MFVATFRQSVEQKKAKNLYFLDMRRTTAVDEEN